MTDKDLIFKIAHRFRKEAAEFYDTKQSLDDACWQIQEDLTNVHMYVQPLQLKALLETDSFNFAHDCVGIMTNVDRENGCFLNNFLPRFSSSSITIESE